MPDRLNSIVLNQLSIMGRIGCIRPPIQISLANFLWCFAEPACDAVNDFLDDQYSLRPAEAAKRRVRRKIRPRHLSAELNRWNEIGIIQVKHRAVGYRRGQ